jgi:hypothetical protein
MVLQSLQRLRGVSKRLARQRHIRDAWAAPGSDHPTRPPFNKMSSQENNEIREAERELERLINNPLKHFMDAINNAGGSNDPETPEGTAQICS